MSYTCPACAQSFTNKQVIRTDEMLPGRKYFGWGSCNYYCPHCKVLLDFVKPKAWPFIDVTLLFLFVLLIQSEHSHYQLFGSSFALQLLILSAFFILFFFRSHLGNTKGRYVLA
jgi:hypothetical protein